MEAVHEEEKLHLDNELGKLCLNKNILYFKWFNIIKIKKYVPKY